MSSRCLVCFGDSLESFYKPRYDISVTSDNRALNVGVEIFSCKECGHLQKTPDDTVLGDIYGGYSTNKLVPNDEQIKFDGVAHKARSAVLLDNMRDILPSSGDVLDVGSGSGGMLKSLFAINPNYKLYANDLNKNAIGEFENIPSFCGFYSELDGVERRFDLITAIHVFEHIKDTEKFLNLIVSLLKQDGVALIQVPDISQNPFDIFVYDHVSHFNKRRLLHLLSKFFKHVAFPKQQINKEITVLVTNKDSFEIDPLDDANGEKTVEISYFEAIFDRLDGAKEEMSVFGTSPICTFFGAILGGRLKNFYDEDSKKQGKTHLGKTTLPLDSYSGETMILPFMGESAEKIVKRLDGIRFFEIDTKNELRFLDGKNIRSVGIEIVGFCNADCTFCPAGVKGFNAKTKFMEPAVFENIIDDFLTKKIVGAGDAVGLFHTSEAFLHPQIDDIFDILEKRNLAAYISSNFMRYPKLDKKHYKRIKSIVFSLSSFQKERYRSVYGGDIDKTLENFNLFLQEIKSENESIDFQVNWIRYRDNIDEEEAAKNYFCQERRLKLNFVNAIFLDIEHYADILTKDDQSTFLEADKKMFLSEQLKIMKYIKGEKLSFSVCEEFFNVVIDVDGNWITCCRTTSRKPQNILGSYKDVNIDAALCRNTKDSDICRFCSAYYLPDSAYLVESAVNVESLMNILDIKQDNGYVIYGSGHLAQVIFEVINNHKAHVSCFIDDVKKGKLFDVDVISFGEFEKLYATTDITIIVSATSSATISKIKDKISSSSLPENISIISL